jgi:hypothetical protein
MKNPVFWDVTPCGSYRTDVSEEYIASVIRMTRFGKLGTTLAVTNNRSRLRRNIPEDGMLQRFKVNLRFLWNNRCLELQDVAAVFCSLTTSVAGKVGSFRSSN